MGGGGGGARRPATKPPPHSATASAGVAAVGAASSSARSLTLIVKWEMGFRMGKGRPFERGRERLSWPAWSAYASETYSRALDRFRLFLALDAA